MCAISSQAFSSALPMAVLSKMHHASTAVDVRSVAASVLMASVL